MKTTFLSLLAAFCVTSSLAQVGIGIAVPHISAQLEVSANGKGVLIPRMGQAQRPASPAKGLLIYQIDGQEGFYYWDGAAWQPLGNGWGLKGNGSTDPSVNFIGTTDNTDFRFKVNSQASGIIGTNGNIGLGLGSLVANTGTQVTAFGYNSLSKNTASANAAFGYGALANNTSASANTALGYLALNANNSSSASGNTAVGYYGLVSNTSGSSNTALGSETLLNSKTGSRNTALGNKALNANDNGSDNTAIGNNALYKSTATSFNTAIGNYALSEHITGTGNTAIGYNALRNRVTNSLNTVLGYSADAKDGLTNATAIGANAQVEASNSLILGAVGTQVGIGTTTPHANAQLDIVGTGKGLLIPRMPSANRPSVAPITEGTLIYQTDGTTGFYYWNGTKWVRLDAENNWGLTGNTGTTSANFIGTKDLNDLNFKVANTPAGTISWNNGNVGLGFNALSANTAINLTAIGYNALSKNSGSLNTAVGYGALANNLDAGANTAIGFNALNANNSSSAFGNTAVGSSALSKNTMGNYNTAIGESALSFNNSGSSNTAVGAQSLSVNIGSSNSSLGHQALNGNTTGSDNIGIGKSSLYSNKTTSSNIAIGTSALSGHISGSGNVAIGYNASPLNTSNTNNTIIGNNARSLDGLSNATALGNGAIVQFSNAIQLGNSSITQVITSGDVVTAGDVYARGVKLISDRRFKSQVRSDVKGLDFIMELKPVTYLFDEQKLADYRDGKVKASELNSYIAPVSYREGSLERRTGFIAQQVEQAAKQVGYAFDGVRVPKNENDIYTLSYSTFVVPLVKAVQEQQTEIESLQEKLKKSEEDKKEQLQKITALQNNEQQLFERLKKLEAKIR